MFRVSVISLISSSGVLFCLSLFCRMVIVSEIGMFVYRFLMSKEANVALWGMCVSFIFVTRSVLFFTAMLLSICVLSNNFI